MKKRYWLLLLLLILSSVLQPNEFHATNVYPSREAALEAALEKISAKDLKPGVYPIKIRFKKGNIEKEETINLTIEADTPPPVHDYRLNASDFSIHISEVEKMEYADWIEKAGATISDVRKRRIMVIEYVDATAVLATAGEYPLVFKSHGKQKDVMVTVYDDDDALVEKPLLEEKTKQQDVVVPPIKDTDDSDFKKNKTYILSGHSNQDTEPRIFELFVSKLYQFVLPGSFIALLLFPILFLLFKLVAMTKLSKDIEHLLHEFENKQI